MSPKARTLHGACRDLIATHPKDLDPTQIVGNGLTIVPQHERMCHPPRQMHGRIQVADTATRADRDKPLLLLQCLVTSFGKPRLIQESGHVVLGE